MNEQEKPKKKRRQYSDEDKAAAVILYHQNSGKPAPLTLTANTLQIPDSNLDAWLKGRGMSEAAWKAVERETKTLVEIFRDITVLSAMEMRERVSDPDTLGAMDNADLARYAREGVQQSQLLAGAPTQITRHEDAAEIAKLRQDAEALLERLIPHYGDREAAMAALREHAPTLSEFVN